MAGERFVVEALNSKLLSVRKRHLRRLSFNWLDGKSVFVLGEMQEKLESETYGLEAKQGKANNTEILIYLLEDLFHSLCLDYMT